MRLFATLLCIVFVVGTSTAQTELGGTSAPSRNWTMLSVHRVWVPQANGFPNGGFGIHSLFSLDESRTMWAGFSVVGTGLHKRDALVIDGGMGWWFLGDSSLGAFAYGLTRLGITSANGLTGFDFFCISFPHLLPS